MRNVLRSLLSVWVLLVGGASVAWAACPTVSSPLECSPCSDPDCTNSTFLSVLDQICDFAPGGDCLDQCCSCTNETSELFAGVTFDFDSPLPVPPDWPGLGGRGELAAKAALCLLRDLGVFEGGEGIPGILNTAGKDFGVLGKASVTQRVALEKFDPVAKTMQGFHSVSICMPVFGCVDDQTQRFTAELLNSDPPGALSCGDFPFKEAWGLKIATSDTEHQLRLQLPTITVPTPIGPVQATPEFNYETFLKAGAPDDVDLDVQEKCMVLSRASLFSLSGLDDGANAVDFLCDLIPQLPLPDFPYGVGEVSQLGLGGRDPDPDGPIEPGSPFPPGSPRPDLDLGIARTNDEKKLVGFGSAQVDFCYSPIDLIPDRFLQPPFDLEGPTVFVKPRIATGFASQFQVHFADARYKGIAVPDGCEPTFNRALVDLRSRSAANVFFEITAGLDFVVKLEVDFGGFLGTITVTLVDIHESEPLFPKLMPPPDFDEGPIAGAEFEDSFDPEFKSLTSFSSAPNSIADPDAFLAECFETPPPPGETPPTPFFTPDDPDELTAVLEFPCNICLAFGSLAQGCGPKEACAKNSSCCSLDGSCGPKYDCDINEAGECIDPSGAGNCEFHTIPPGALPPDVANLVAVLFDAPQDLLGKQWLCDSPEKSGCMDLCTYDPTAAQPLKVVQSAVDLDPERCGGGPGTGRPCTSDTHCNDGNPCTKDDCTLEGEFGTCTYSAQDGPCDDGLFCDGADRCALGACALHDGNPCAPAGNCCDESTDACVEECPVPLPRCGNGLLQPGEGCDDGNTTGGDGCSATCEIEQEELDCGDAVASLTELWPPNHQLVEVSVGGVTDPNGGPVSITITGITQDELLNGPGDGDTCPDAAGVGTSTARLRAERAGPPWLPADGRVYHVSFAATSDTSGACNGTVTVCVPHDRRPGLACGDQGALVDSTSPCP